MKNPDWIRPYEMPRKLQRLFADRYGQSYSDAYYLATARGQALQKRQLEAFCEEAKNKMALARVRGENLDDGA